MSATVSQPERRLGMLTTDEIAAISKADALVLQPIGATEQHGPHLPCLTDALIAQAAAERAVAQLPVDANVWLLPPLWYGKSTEHLGRPGTVSMSAQTLVSVCLDLGRSLAASGFRKLAFVNGHGGQPALLDMVARDIRYDTGLQVFPLMVSRLGLPEDVVSSDAGFGIHAGEVETSVMMALEPSTVRSDRLPVDGADVAKLFADCEHLTLEGAIPTAWLTDDLSESGVIGDARGANAELGERVLRHWSARLAVALTEMAAFEFPRTR
ncbi:creatininase family protein [Actinopolymorpha alba]|uniref:creatininase family protein n=1 Tax=Actinopolymorpha alba TaxID=533267 RepID=UPI0003740BE1|nr:creatininase family protein [Actinopolymorpha alba]